VLSRAISWLRSRLGLAKAQEEICVTPYEMVPFDFKVDWFTESTELLAEKQGSSTDSLPEPPGGSSVSRDGVDGESGLTLAWSRPIASNDSQYGCPTGANPLSTLWRVAYFPPNHPIWRKPW
jgi:hypothetical protein